MPKRIKTTLYIILVLAIIAVVWLMFGQTNIKTETQTDENIEILTGNDTIDTIDFEEPGLTTNTDAPTFEEDVMKDLEGFFNDNNGYEDIEGEFGFTSLEAE